MLKYWIDSLTTKLKKASLLIPTIHFEASYQDHYAIYRTNDRIGWDVEKGRIEEGYDILNYLCEICDVGVWTFAFILIWSSSLGLDITL